MKNRNFIMVQAAQEMTLEAIHALEQIVTNSFASILNSMNIEPDIKSDDRYMSMQEACDYTAIPADTLYKLTSGNKIAYIRPNKGKVYFKKSDLDAYMERGRIPSNDELLGRR